MKLFGNTGRGRPQPKAPQPEPSRAETPRQAPPKPWQREDRVEFTQVPPPPKPPVAVVNYRSADTSWTAAPAPRKSRFWLGYWLYVVLFLAIVTGALYYVWQRLDVYEQSLPYRVMDAWLEGADTAYWREMLRRFGVGESYLDTLDFTQVDYYKKLDRYTDEEPVYGLRFGGKTMLTAALAPGEELKYGRHGWVIDLVSVVDSHLAVYAPVDAVLTVNGVPIPDDTPVQPDAQPLTLGPLEASLDLPGLAKFTLNRLFTVDGLTVTDAAGEPLELAYSTGSSYYYPPLTRDYEICAPSELTVSVNGVTLTAENSEMTSEAIDAFDGIEDVLSAVPEFVTYRVTGLVARPAVLARGSDGVAQEPAQETEERWTYSLLPDEGLRSELSDYILQVFDAYIAYLGNRGYDLYGNYARYLQYVRDGSEAADRAKRALDSIYWVKNRDTNPASVTLGPVLRYSEDCFTAQVDFTMTGSDESNGYLFVFQRSDGAWKVIRVLNTTSMV